MKHIVVAHLKNGTIVRSVATEIMPRQFDALQKMFDEFEKWKVVNINSEEGSRVSIAAREVAFIEHFKIEDDPSEQASAE